MKKNVKHAMALAMSLIISLTLLGCGGNEVPALSINKNETSVSVKEEAPKATTKNGSITDFYEYVNGEWLSETVLEDYAFSYSGFDDYRDEYEDRLEAIFTSDELMALPEDDGLNKLNRYFKQLNNPEQVDISMQEIKKITDTIQKVKSVSDIQKLMEDENYSLFNNLVSPQCGLNSNGNYGPVLYYVNPMEAYGNVMDKYVKAYATGYTNQLKILGYDEEEATRITDNGIDFFRDLLLYEGRTTFKGMIWYNEERLDSSGCTLDLLSIFNKSGYCARTKINWEDPGFFAEPTYIDWLKDNVTDANIEKVKDFYTLSVLENTYLYGNEDYLNAYDSILDTIFGLETKTEINENGLALSAIIMNDSGILANYYADKYITPEQIEKSSQIVEDLKNAYLEIIADMDWLDTKQRERFNIRLKKTKFLLGRLDEVNTLEDFEVCENPFLTTLSLLKSNRAYHQRVLKEGVRGLHYNYTMFTVNAYYDSDENTVILANGLFAHPTIWESDSYEELMGGFGSVIAHEIGHSFDNNNCGKKPNGVWDEEYDAIRDNYSNLINSVYDSLCGMTTENGNVVDGSRVLNDSIADLAAVKAALRALKDKGCSDYDTFFKAYTDFYKEIQKPSYEEFLTKFDFHIPPRERVNYSLFYFDEFYDTYDIDKKSKYYVKESDRVTFFE